MKIRQILEALRGADPESQFEVIDGFGINHRVERVEIATKKAGDSYYSERMMKSLRKVDGFSRQRFHEPKHPKIYAVIK